MMTSKSVRRNVTRSWGLSLEKIEFFSTDFLWRWLDFSYASAGHPSIHLHLWSQLLCSALKNHLSSPFSRQKIAQFMKFDEIETSKLLYMRAKRASFILNFRAKNQQNGNFENLGEEGETFLLIFKYCVKV